MEVNAHVDRDEYVVFCRDVLDRTVKADAVARDHDHDLAVEAETRVTAGCHDANIVPAALFERHHAGRDVHIPGKAVRVVDEDHERRVVFVTTALCDEAGCLFRLTGIQLHESRWLREPALHGVTVHCVRSSIIHI